MKYLRRGKTVKSYFGMSQVVHEINICDVTEVGCY
jgi:hypothetical protein